MEIYIFKKSGFKNRQSAKLKDAKSRNSILIDVHLQNDGKILLLHSQKDYTLLGTYLHILSRIDLEDEVWQVRVDEFKNWFRKTFNVGNKFEIEKRIQWLADAGLFEFYSTSIEPLLPSYRDPIKGLLPEKTAIEPPESHAPVISNNNQPTNKPTKEKDTLSLPSEFEEAAEYAFSHARNSTTNHNIGWVKPRLEEAFKQHENPKFVLDCWKSACDAGWDKGQNYVKKVFANKLTEQAAIPVPSLPSAAPKKKPHIDVLMAAKRIVNRFDSTLNYETKDIERSMDMLFINNMPISITEFDPVEE
jgi:hypothetical protein